GRADLTMVQQVEGGGPVSVITIKLKGDKARIEAAQMTTLMDGKTGDIITLMNAQKKFVRISGDKAKAIAEMASKYSGTTATTEKPKPTATGRKEIINGYETEEYVWETPKLKASYWIAPKFPDGPAIMKQLQAATPTLWNDIAKGMLEYSHRAWLRVSFSLPNHRVVVNCSRTPATRSRSSHRRSKKFRMTGSRFVN